MSLQDKIDAYNKYLETWSNIADFSSALNIKYYVDFYKIPKIMKRVRWAMEDVEREMKGLDINVLTGVELHGSGLYYVEKGVAYDYNPMNMSTGLVNLINNTVDSVNKTMFDIEDEINLIAEKPMELIDNMTQPAARPFYD